MAQADSIESAIQDVTNQTSIEGLAARAEELAMATALSDTDKCEIGGREVACSSYRVDTLLSGAVSSENIHAYTVLGYDAGPRRALLFLKRAGNAYEVLGITGRGRLAADRDSITELGITVPQAIERVRKRLKAPGVGSTHE